MSVLGDRDISRRLDEIFEKGTADLARVRGAKYYLTLGNRFLILPSGRRYPDAETGSPARCRPFALKPGQTALISTKERLAMPGDLSGIFGPSLNLSDNGILFFGGMLVDPGFGFSKESWGWKRTPEPLSFYVANVGSDTFQLRPGEERIASIAFLKVSDPRDEPQFEVSTAREVRNEMFDASRNDPPDRPLGLVEDISQIRERVDRFEASTKQLVLFGVIVLAVTLFAAMVSLIAGDAGGSIALTVRWYEVFLPLLAIGAAPAGLAATFYLWVCAKLKRLELKDQKLAKSKERAGERGA